MRALSCDPEVDGEHLLPPVLRRACIGETEQQVEKEVSLFIGLLRTIKNHPSEDPVYQARVTMGVLESLRERIMDNCGPMAEHLIRSMTPITERDALSKKPKPEEDVEGCHP